MAVLQSVICLTTKKLQVLLHMPDSCRAVRSQGCSRGFMIAHSHMPVYSIWASRNIATSLITQCYFMLACKLIGVYQSIL